MADPGNCQLTVLAPIDYLRGGPQDKLTRLEAVLDGLDTAQPYQDRDQRQHLLFGDIDAVHMARFLIIDEAPVQMGVDNSGQLVSKYLLFIAELDGGRDRFLDQLFRTRPREVKAIWENCLGYPENCTANRFARFMREYEVATTLPYSAYAGTSQTAIGGLLELQRELTEFIFESQKTADPKSLRKDWRKLLETSIDPHLTPRERRRLLP